MKFSHVENASGDGGGEGVLPTRVWGVTELELGGLRLHPPTRPSSG